MINSILQTEAWAAFKSQFGWKRVKSASYNGLERLIGYGKSILYYPELPLNDSVLKLIHQAKQEKAPAGRIFTRFEFIELWTQDKVRQLVESGLTKAFEDVQPEYRQWIPLDKTEAELLKDMKPKGRYNIRVAERHRLQTSWGTEDGKLEVFYQLYSQTAERAEFKGRNLGYFQALLTTLRSAGLGEVVIISHQGQPLAAAIISYYEGIASYLYGGSGGDRSLMAPYLMHWEVMKRAKERGCLLYDLLAVAPTDQEKHVHAGLSRFKAQFGGQTVRLVGGWDLVHSPIWYTLYRLAQRRRRRSLH